eukprot:gene470-498_t
MGVSSTNNKDVVYSPASEALITNRKIICEYSFAASRERILKTKATRSSESLQADEDRNAASLYLNSKELILSASQFGGDRPLTSIRFSPKGDLLATGSLNETVRLWSTSTLAEVAAFRGHTERVTSLCWSQLASNGSDPSGELNAHPLLASTSADGTCILWNVSRYSSKLSTTEPWDSVKEGCSALDEMDVDGSQGNITYPELIAHRLKGHQGVVSDCDFHPSGNYVGTAGHDACWRLWDVERGEELLVQDGHIKECSVISFQRDGALVVTADWAGVVLVWDLRTGQCIQTLQGHIKKIVTAAFSPNGFQVATGAADHMVRVWDLRKKKCGYALPGHSNVISCARYSASGELLVTSSFDGAVKVWNARNFDLLRSLSGHTGKVMSCDISPDEKRVVSAGFDRTIKVWAHRDEF